MRPRTLALLFLVVAALLAFIWLYERQLPSSDERLEQAKKVLRLAADEVRGITVVRGAERLRLERAVASEEGEEATTGAWQLREPLHGAADAGAVDRLVGDLVELEKERTLSGGDRVELGLAEPRATVLLETAAATVELLVGSQVPASSTMIVAIGGGEDAYVVADSLWTELTKPAGDWRNRDLGPGSRDEIERVALVEGERRVTLARRGESFWVESPYVDRAAKDLVSDLVGELVGLRVESFVDDPQATPAELGLEPPAGAVEVVLEGREEALRLELGAAAGDDGELRLARLDGQLFETRSDLLAAVSRAPEEWRELGWSSLEVYRIERLEARDEQGETVFERQAGDWLRDGEPVDYTPVSDLLYAVTGVEAVGAESGAAAAGEPALTLVLAGDGDLEETLTLYPALSDGTSLARVSGREVALRLAEGAVSDLLVKLDEARRAAARPADQPGELEAVGSE